MDEPNVKKIHTAINEVVHQAVQAGASPIEVAAIDTVVRPYLILMQRAEDKGVDVSEVLQASVSCVGNMIANTMFRMSPDKEMAVALTNSYFLELGAAVQNAVDEQYVPGPEARFIVPGNDSGTQH